MFAFFIKKSSLPFNSSIYFSFQIKSTRAQVLNFFNSWKNSVNLLVRKSKIKTNNFHKKIVHVPQSQSDALIAAPSMATAPTTIPEGSAKYESIPLTRLESERLALQLVESARVARHNAAATLAPSLDPQGGVKDIHSAVNISTFAKLTATLSEPTFTGQFQLCDALLATTDVNAYAYLRDNANLAAALQTMVYRGIKSKQITLAVRALNAMTHFGGFNKTFLKYNTMRLLTTVVRGDVPPGRIYADGGALHPGVREATMRFLALHPEELLKAMNPQAEEGTNNEAGAEQQQQQQQQQQDGEEKAPFESAEPSSEGISDRDEDEELGAPRSSEEREATAAAEQQRSFDAAATALAFAAAAAAELLP